MPEENNNIALTIFDQVAEKEVSDAIKNLISGKTPKKEIKWRDGPRDKVTGELTKVPYVNTYYVTRQGSLITGFRWSSECIEEKTFPDKPPYQELGARMKVTIWDKNGNQFSHTIWGAAKIKQGIGFFNQWKAAYSDGIKKCWSYFGVANDVYGARDLQFLGDEPPDSSGAKTVDIEIDDKSVKVSSTKAEFLKYIKANKILLTTVFKLLNIEDIDDIKDFEVALNTMKELR